MLILIVNCGPAEEYIEDCLVSIQRQSVEEWQAFVTVDPAGDATLERARDARGDDSRIHIHGNARWQGPMVNTIQAVRASGARPDDVTVVLDGDDKFAMPDALHIIENAYREFDCWLTYGSWLSNLADGQGMWPAYPEGLQDFRSHRWLGTAVRTWKRWLWDLVDDSDFRDASGEYLAVGEDQAILLPMLEMSGPRARHIPQALMIYTRSSPHRVCYTRDAESRSNSAYLTSLPPYSRLKNRPASAAEAQAVLEARRQVRQAHAHGQSARAASADSV
jgi:glycosyltransferase involved in cell wall biosynthesis